MNERITQRRQDFFNALERLKEGVKEEANEIVIDGILHRYEFTFELAWKTIKDYLEYNGIVNDIASPRGIIQQAYASKVIDNGKIWIQMMLDRNSLSYLYDEKKSRIIYDNIRNKYILELKKLKQFLEVKI